MHPPFYRDASRLVKGHFPIGAQKMQSYGSAMNEAGENILQTRLRALMSERQIKPATLALKAGLSDSYVRDILRGKASNPKAE